MSMENYKIYIDEKGIIKAILLPEEPKLTPSITMVAHAGEMKDYREALSKAKQEAIPFKNQIEVCGQLSDMYLEVIFPKENLDTIHDLPEGYSVEVEHQVLNQFNNNWDNVNERTASEYARVKGASHSRTIATLKKISPPLSVSEPVQPTPSEKEVFREKFEEWRIANKVSIEQHFYPGGRADAEIYNFDEGVFDFFYSEIEKRKEAYDLAMAYEKAGWYKDEGFDKISKELTLLRAQLEEKEEETLDLIVTFNLSTSFTSVDEAKAELPKLFESKKQAAKDWVETLKKEKI